MNEYNNFNEIDYKYLKCILKFINIFSKELSHCNNTYLKDNLKTLEIT